MTRIEKCFAGLKSEGKKGFVAYITAGDPNLSATREYVLRMEKAGVDIVELGIPFSDPLADGRVNQLSAARALESGTTIQGVYELVRDLRKQTQIPIVCYTYMNPLHALGFDRMLKEASDAGVDGMLVLDLPAEESGPYLESFKKHNVHNIRLVTPTSPDARVKRIVQSGSGFIYCVSREGVTGAQKKLSAGAAGVVQRTRKFTKLPVAIGFGISSPEQAAEAASICDAVVVGSAIVDRLHAANGSRTELDGAIQWIGRMADAAHRA